MDIINIADLVDPDDPQGRTYRQINAAKAHVIPLGALVQLESGARLFVVLHGRDCDQTPLYCLATEPDEEDKYRWLGGYSEESMTVVKP